MCCKCKEACVLSLLEALFVWNASTAKRSTWQRAAPHRARRPRRPCPMSNSSGDTECGTAPSSCSTVAASSTAEAGAGRGRVRERHGTAMGTGTDAPCQGNRRFRGRETGDRVASRGVPMRDGLEEQTHPPTPPPSSGGEGGLPWGRTSESQWFVQVRRDPRHSGRRPGRGTRWRGPRRGRRGGRGTGWAPPAPARRSGSSGPARSSPPPDGPRQGRAGPPRCPPSEMHIVPALAPGVREGPRSATMGFAPKVNTTDHKSSWLTAAS